VDIAAVQAALMADGIDAWLLYDFRGLKPIAADVTGVGQQGRHLAARGWCYLVCVSGAGLRTAFREPATRANAACG
jgi:hypothetical protein